MRDKKVKMIQVTRYRWELRAPKGALLVDNLLIDSRHKAEEWVKSYVSSYNDWTYEIIMKKDEK